MDLRTITNKFRLITIMLAAAAAVAFVGPAKAAGNASYSISPSSGSYNINTEFTVTVYEDSGSEPVNAVEANLTYDQSKLQFVGLSTSGSPFTTCTQTTGGSGNVSIVCALLGNSVTGRQKVGSITFRALVGSGSSSVNFATSSKIVRSTDNSDIWNGDTTGGTYTFTIPAAPSPAPPSPSPAPSTSPGTPKPASSSTSPASPGAPSDPAAPAPANNMPAAESGYLVAIKVINYKGQPVVKAKVRLAGQTAISDSSGVASFTSVPAGNHKVTVDAPAGKKTLTVDVSSGKTAAEVQQFEVKLASYQQLLDILGKIVAGLGASALIAAVGLLVRQRLQSRFQPSSLPAAVIAPVNTVAIPSPAASTSQDDVSQRLQHINGSRPIAPGSMVGPGGD